MTRIGSTPTSTTPPAARPRRGAGTPTGPAATSPASTGHAQGRAGADALERRRGPVAHTHVLAAPAHADQASQRRTVFDHDHDHRARSAGTGRATDGADGHDHGTTTSPTSPKDPAAPTPAAPPQQVLDEAFALVESSPTGAAALAAAREHGVDDRDQRRRDFAHYDTTAGEHGQSCSTRSRSPTRSWRPGCSCTRSGTRCSTRRPARGDLLAARRRRPLANE